VGLAIIIGGAVLSFNLVALLAPVLSAFACFLLIRSITKRYLPALLGGYIYGFSTFEMGQILGHPQMYVNFPVPLIVLLGWLFFNGRLRAVPFVILSCILLTFQFGVSTEIFATFFVFATLTLVLFYFFSAPEQKQKLVALAMRFYGVVGLTLVIASPYLYYMAKGYHDVPAVLHPLDIYSTNALNFLIPTPVTQIGGHLTFPLSKHFTGNPSEQGAYIGVPFVALLVYVTLKFYRKVYMLVLVLLLSLIALLSMGPRLRFIGHIGYFPLPWAAPAHLPLLKSALPARFSMYIFLPLAIIIGIWLSFETTRRNQVYKYIVTLVAIAFIVPATSYYYWGKVSVPTAFAKGQIEHYIPQGSNVILLPYERYGEGIYYQYISGMWFTLSGGYVGFVPASYTNDALVNSLFSGTPDSSFASELKQFCRANNVAEVIYTPKTPPKLIEAINNIGWQAIHTNGATIMDVPVGTN
jgi:hypothetical protein